MVEEWNFFRRIEDLEEKLEEIEGQVPMEALPMVYYTFLMSFYALCLHDPGSARKYKGIILGGMRKRGFNPRLLEVLEELLNSVVEDFERRHKD